MTSEHLDRIPKTMETIERGKMYLILENINHVVLNLEHTID
jgi:hypothetical protein